MSWTRPNLHLLGAIAGSYAISAVAAGFFSALLFTIEASASQWNENQPLAAALGAVIAYFFMASLLSVTIAFFGVFPFALAIFILRFFRRRDLLSHALTGLVVSLVAICLVPGRSTIVERLESSWVIFAAGVIAGTVYWFTFDYLAKPIRSLEEMR